MTLDDVHNYFVTFRNAMRKAGLSNTAYLNWRKYGYIPYHSQVKLANASNGFLTVDGVNKYVEAKKGCMPKVNQQRTKKLD